ncbi:Qb-SNARE, NPSN-family [Volvox carteri f. nagariensis]|uniref:Qb-SNARE, NPSN-family n=1 Tax=Volvox carteri f. nagariensis TaxID=3068 RepID=D8TZH7_VOLCA|nr:Qb-SNARE, NPSN-family [Volvox carteri f. nagariensis]EFJ47278.1 Qb-SNARE, NPSN-family [Volvox carteri f. nagariensis]|eukprot:XP_002951827.1 Qb-SNARE, NPSN-family [Volvox carteri f. nagariensis]
MPPKAAKEESPPPQEEIVFERTEYEEQCDRIFKDLDRAFKKLHKTSKPDKIHAQIKDITNKLKEAKSLIKDFEREARADGMPASELTARKRAMAAELNGFIEMKKQFAQNEGNKGDLLSGAQAGERNGYCIHVDLVVCGHLAACYAAMSMQQLMSKGRKDIADIDKTLDRAQRIAEDTKQVGVALGQTLNDQTKKMEDIVDQLNEIEFTMKKATQIIRDITRGLLTDKCIAFLLLLVVLGVVAIIVIKIINPNRKKVQEGAQAIISNVTSAINSTDVGSTITSKVTNTVNGILNNGSSSSSSAGRRMLAQKVLLHALELNATL